MRVRVRVHTDLIAPRSLRILEDCASSVVATKVATAYFLCHWLCCSRLQQVMSEQRELVENVVSASCPE